MIAVLASAPGKLFLTGEYAVLEGAPALLAAVDVRATCRLTPSSSATWRLHTPPVSSSPAVFSVSHGEMRWKNGRVPLFDAAWQALSAPYRDALAASGGDIVLDTSAFFRGGHKLGLGSSAAAMTALLGVLWRAAGDLPPQPQALAMLAAAHAIWNGGGSGADLAASLVGGTFLYRREPRTVTPVALPAVGIVPVWTGAPASTSGFLRRLASFREASPAVFRERLAAIAAQAEAAARAAHADEVPAFLTAFEASGAALHALGKAAGLDIWSEPHRRIAAIVREHGGCYKPSGAGGGDVGLALLARDAALDLEGLESSLSLAGYTVLPLRLGASGLHTTSD